MYAAIAATAAAIIGEFNVKEVCAHYSDAVSDRINTQTLVFQIIHAKVNAAGEVEEIVEHTEQQPEATQEGELREAGAEQQEQQQLKSESSTVTKEDHQQKTKPKQE